MMARLAQALSGKLMNESHRMFFRRRHGSRIGWGIQRKLLADLIVGNLRMRSVAEGGVRGCLLALAKEGLTILSRCKGFGFEVASCM
jgi:hypothetical protein